jgi:hypothetical protein
VPTGEDARGESHALRTTRWQIRPYQRQSRSNKRDRTSRTGINCQTGRLAAWSGIFDQRACVRTSAPVPCVLLALVLAPSLEPSIPRTFWSISGSPCNVLPKLKLFLFLMQGQGVRWGRMPRDGASIVVTADAADGHGNYFVERRSADNHLQNPRVGFCMRQQHTCQGH